MPLSPLDPTPPKLPAAARYFPPAKGRYEVKAGLQPLGTDFGNGAADGGVFQVDGDWPWYRRERLAARREALGKYVCTAEPSDAAQNALSAFCVDRLSREYPGLFSLERHVLRCRLTGETLVFDDRLELVEAKRGVGVDGAQPPFVKSRRSGRLKARLVATGTSYPSLRCAARNAG